MSQEHSVSSPQSGAPPERTSARKRQTPPARRTNSVLDDLTVEPGMVEVCISLAGIAAAIATFLPSAGSIPPVLRQAVAIVAGIMAVFSAYSALWLLARYALKGHSATGASEIWKLLRSPWAGPLWFVALALAGWAMLSFLLVLVAMLRR